MAEQRDSKSLGSLLPLLEVRRRRDAKAFRGPVCVWDGGVPWCLHPQTLPREMRSVVCSILSPAKSICRPWDLMRGGKEKQPPPADLARVPRAWRAAPDTVQRFTSPVIKMLGSWLALFIHASEKAYNILCNFSSHGGS